MAHLQEQGINFAVFDADSVDKTAPSRASVLRRLTKSAHNAGLRVDKAVLAFAEGTRINYYGAPDLVSFLVSAQWRPSWTHTLSVDS